MATTFQYRAGKPPAVDPQHQAQDLHNQTIGRLLKQYEDLGITVPAANKHNELGVAHTKSPRSPR